MFHILLKLYFNTYGLFVSISENILGAIFAVPSESSMRYSLFLTLHIVQM